MRKYLLVTTFFFISIFLSLTFAGTVVRAERDYVEGEIIVRYKSDVSEAAVVRSLSSKGAERLGGTKRQNLHFIRLPEGTTVEDAIIEYKQDPNVLYAEPNYRVHASAVSRRDPNDTEFTRQWSLDNPGTSRTFGPSNNLTGTADIDAPEAWFINTGTSSTVIAVLDTGMDLDHEDLLNSLWINTGETASNSIDDDGNDYIDDINGYDFLNDDNDPDDDNFRVGTTTLNNHGTHICGIIGAEGDNTTGIAGSNWNSQLMILKILDEDGGGDVGDITEAIDYAIDKGAKIINASWGLDPSSTDFSQSLYDKIESAKDNGILFITAAGNTSTVEWPTRFNLDNIISVTATGINDELTDFGIGINPATNVEDVDLAAPGNLIYSTFIQNNPNTNKGDGPGDEFYYWNSGTSQSAALVTGVAGLLLSEDPTLTTDQIKALILSNVDTVSDVSITSSTASGGRLNAYNALDALQKINLGTATEDDAVIVPFTTGLNVEETRQFTLFGDTASNWKSTDTSVGTIDASGIFTAKAAGTCEVTVDGAGSNTYTTATIYVKDISVTFSSTSLGVGEQMGFSISGGTSPYTWASNNESVIAVDSSGLVTALKAGSGRITATDAKGYFETSAAINVIGDRSSKNGNCFIATAAFGSPMERHVRTLQDFRDRYLMTNAPGKAFVDYYYQYSPPIADWIAERPLLRTVVKILLTPLVLFGSFMMKTGLSWKGLFLGMLLIMISAGMYFRKQSKRNLGTQRITGG